MIHIIGIAVRTHCSRSSGNNKQGHDKHQADGNLEFFGFHFFTPRTKDLLALFAHLW
jgi:hypothetical protein